ncbi:MAG: hypothetical protein JW706_00535 [Opitutales bacterium]|nr:hypothetical protein [Opitutales bacterium]
MAIDDLGTVIGLKWFIIIALVLIVEYLLLSILSIKSVCAVAPGIMESLTFWIWDMLTILALTAPGIYVNRVISGNRPYGADELDLTPILTVLIGVFILALVRMKLLSNTLGYAVSYLQALSIVVIHLFYFFLINGAILILTMRPFLEQFIG